MTSLFRFPFPFEEGTDPPSVRSILGLTTSGSAFINRKDKRGSKASDPAPAIGREDQSDNGATDLDAFACGSLGLGPLFCGIQEDLDEK